MTSRPCSPASRAVISEPERDAASTTSTPRASPDISRLRRGKLCACGGVPVGNSLTSAPRRGDARCELAVRCRVHAVEPGAADRDRDAAARRAPRGAPAASMPDASPLVIAKPAAASRAAKSKAVSRPAAVAARLPTIATCGRDRTRGVALDEQRGGMPGTAASCGG